jgi:SAM-dependent methyltransferase
VSVERARMVAALYDQKAEEYDDHFRRPIDIAEDRVLYGWVRPYVDGRDVLDVGCGTGALLDHTAPRTWIGVDISQRMLQRADSRAQHVRQYGTFAAVREPMDWSAIPSHSLFQMNFEEKFDTVVCLWAFSYMPNPGQAMANISKSLRPGGTAIIHAYDARYPEREHYVLNGASRQTVTPWTAADLCALARAVKLDPFDIRGFRFCADASRHRYMPVGMMANLMRLGGATRDPAAGLTRVLFARRDW